MGEGVESIEPAPDGTLWFGGEGGVSHFDPETGEWRNFTAADGLPAGDVYVLHVDADGQVWISGGDALTPLVFDGAEWGPPAGAGDVLETVYDVAASPDGVLWLAAGQLVRYEAGVWQVVPDPEDQWIERVAATPDGTVWTGAYGVGIRHYDPATGQWQSFTPADGLAAVEVHTIFIDQEGAVWVGTSAGLSRWGGGQLAPSQSLRCRQPISVWIVTCSTTIYSTGGIARDDRPAPAARDTGAERAKGPLAPLPAGLSAC